MAVDSMEKMSEINNKRRTSGIYIYIHIYYWSDFPSQQPSEEK